MATDKQRLVEEIFVAAVGAPPDAREAILRDRCGGDPSLRQEVLSLLNMHEQETGVLDVPQPLTMGVMKQISGLLRTDDAQLPPDSRIGAYHVQRVIGSGGMGVVYLAEQERPRRTVALKVIRRGLATSSLLRRFEHEAEVLGRLHHSGIAQIYEAGVSDYGFGPQPYIAMEYVDGRQLLDYAEINRLGTRERLALIAKICDAVQHAHQRGVIHRDLKPANILVQAEDTTLATLPKTDTRTVAMFAGVGQPKVLDFGVARIADGRPQATTMRTGVGQLIGTLAYMSPEQFGSDTRDIDVRSDVYSLGVVLFQLLTGKLPFDVTNRALPEAVRMIKDDEPTRLSTINKTFRGDLDTIVYKALEKDRNRRYQSAAEFGADLQRFLLDEPIAAKRDSSMYLLSKKLRRYRGVMIAASVALVATVALAVNSLMSAWEYKAVATAEQQATQSERAARELVSDLNVKLQAELMAANIERGKMEAATGNVILAEDIIWPAYLKGINRRQAKWALWEMYARSPCLWSVSVGGPIDASAWSSDGSLLAVARQNGSVTLHRSVDGARVGVVPGVRRTVTGMHFSPDGSRLAIASVPADVTVMELWDNGREIVPIAASRMFSGPASAIAWSPNGRYIAVGGRDRTLRVWDVAAGGFVSEQIAHASAISAMAFSPDSLQVATGSGDTGAEARIRLWSVPAGELAEELSSNTVGVSALAFAPDDSSIAVGLSSRAIAVLDLQTSSLRVSGAGMGWYVTWFDYSSAGSRLLVCGGSSPVVCFMPEAIELMRLPQHQSQVSAGKWLNSTNAVTVSFDGTIKAWDARKARGMRGMGHFTSWCFGTAYSPDGAVLAAGSGDGTIVLADSFSRQRLHTIQTGSRVRTRAVCFIENGAKLLAGSNDGLIRTIDVSSGEIIGQMSTTPPRQEIFALSLHPDGRILAASCADRCVRIWDRLRQRLVHLITGLANRSEGVAFSPDGSLLVTSGPSSGVAVYRTSDWSHVVSLPGSGQAWCVAFSPDGSRLAASTWNNSVDLWDTSTWRRLPSLVGHRGLLSTICFSPDGVYLASGGDDATVRVWDVATSRCLATMETAHGEATGLSFHPSGRYLTTGCQNQMVVTWDLEMSNACIEGNTAYQRARQESREQEDQ